MLTTDQIILLAFIGLWMVIGIVTYAILLKYTKQEYRKFYPHPIVSIVKDINSDTKFKFWEKLFIFTCLNIIYLPIICEWLIAWCLYKFWKFIYIDDTVEGQAEKEISEFKEINEEHIENAKQIVEEGLNNPEYINKHERTNQSKESNEFFEYMRLQNAQSDLEAEVYKNVQTDLSKLNDVDHTKSAQEPLMHECPIIMSNEEKKPKRKHTKKTKSTIDDEVKDEAKNN